MDFAYSAALLACFFVFIVEILDETSYKINNGNYTKPFYTSCYDLINHLSFVFKLKVTELNWFSVQLK